MPFFVFIKIPIYNNFLINRYIDKNLKRQCIFVKLGGSKLIIDGKNLGYIEINEMIKNLDKEEIILENLDGKRYIGNKIKNKKLIIKGNLGSKAGKELEETEISLHGNCEDAIGDSMKSGKIIVEGNCGDAVGYSMQGGKIFVLGNAGYRVGIHMTQEKDATSVIVIGGSVGDFLGESQRDGKIIVLGLNNDECPVGKYCASEISGGDIYIRSKRKPKELFNDAMCEELENGLEIEKYLKEFSEEFKVNFDEILNSKYFKISSK